MDLNQLVIARQGYTVLDFFSDIGGIQSLLIQAAAIFVYAWTYHQIDDYMVSKLYRVVKTPRVANAVDGLDAPSAPGSPSNRKPPDAKGA